jgi:hypothetical protein
MAHNVPVLLAFELKKLEEMADLLAPVRQTGGGFQIPDHFEQAVEKEVTRICDALTSALFSSARDDVLERLVQHHQTVAIHLADKLYQWLQRSTAGPHSNIREQLIRHLISQLFRLLDYFERYFSKYFNLDSKIPEQYGMLSARELAGQLAHLLGLLGAISDEILKNCLAGYLGPFAQGATVSPMSYRELIYLKTYIGEISGVLEKARDPEPEADLIVALYYLNFNHLAFFTYCQQRFRGEAAAARSAKEYAAMISTALAALRSTRTKPGFYFHQDWPGIKEMMETWLRDELEIAMASQKTINPSSQVIAIADEEKIELQLSVSQIACLTRLFYEEHIFPEASVIDLLKFVSRHYRSKRQQQISHGSLSKEYYGISQVTAAVVRDLLQRMVSRINKLYFPVWAAACAVYCCF